MTTLWAYNSALADELDLRPGKRANCILYLYLKTNGPNTITFIFAGLKVRISRLFDDSWAYGTLLEGPQAGRQGVFVLLMQRITY